MAVGVPLRRRDGKDKVTGRARYAATLEMPGMLHCAVLRSPVPHARLVRIDVSQAQRAAGVVAVLTGQDLSAICVSNTFGPAYKDQPVVAFDRVRFVGDIVAAVAAETREQAQYACELIDVEYEELPGVYSPQEAMAEGAPLLHAGLALPVQAMSDLAKALRPIPEKNIANHFHLRQGDVESGYKEADIVVEGTFTFPHISHAPMETHATVASWDGGGRLHVWSATQTPYLVRQQLAELFDVPQSKVQVMVNYLGGGFGGKTYPKLEPLTATLARKAGRPVRFVVSREEEFLTVTRHAVSVKMKSGARRDGTMVFREVEILWDTGAYADIGPRLIRNGAYASPGPYRIPHLKVDSYCVYTNKPPAGAFRGYGVSKVCPAYEVQMDELAHKLGMDPLAFRLKNIHRSGDIYATGEDLGHVAFAECLETAARNVAWTHQPPPARLPATGKVRGKGLAVLIKGTVTPSTSAAAIKMNEDGSVNVLISSVEMGQGAETIFAQIAADAVGVPVEQVYVTQPDTDITPYDLTTSSSRSTYSMGNAIGIAAEDVRKQLLELASTLLEADPADLTVQDGAVRRKGDPGPGIPVAAVMRSPGGARLGTLVGRGSFGTTGGVDSDTGQGRASEFWSAAAAGAEVEVDVETGQWHVLKYATAVHSGTPVNPALTAGQSEGSAIMGLGIAKMEEIKFQDGQPVNASFLDYQIPSLVDVPDVMHPAMITDKAEKGPFGAKGMGETDLPAVVPAVANAIYNACGVRLRAVPFTPDKVLAGLKKLREEA